MQTAAYTCVSKCPYFNPWGNPVLYPRRRDTQGPQGLCTRTIQTRRLAPTVGEASQTHKFQVSLLFVDHRIVSLDMPPLCKWPEVGFFLLAAAWVGPGRSALQSAEQWCRDIIVKSTSWVRCQFLTIVQKHAEGQRKQQLATKPQRYKTIHEEGRRLQQRGLR